MDEMAKVRVLQTHTILRLRCSDKNSASGIEMAPKWAREINTRDRKWTKSEKNRCGLHLAEERPEPPRDHPSYWTKAAWSSLLPSSTSPNGIRSQQVKYCLRVCGVCTVKSELLIFGPETVFCQVSSVIVCTPFLATAIPNDRPDRSVCWDLTG